MLGVNTGSQNWGNSVGAWVLLKQPQPAGGQRAWGQPSSPAVARVLQLQPGAWHLHSHRGGRATGQQSQGSQSCLSITSYKGLFELTGCWTHSISKVSKAANDGEPDREYVNEK